MPEIFSGAGTIMKFLSPTLIFITKFTGIRSKENVTRLVNSASAHKVTKCLQLQTLFIYIPQR